MKKLLYFISILIAVFHFQTGQAQTKSLTVETWIKDSQRENFQPSGRIFLFVNANQRNEPRNSTWPNQSNMIFATNVDNWNIDEPFIFDASKEFTKSVNIQLNQLPENSYTIQVLWDQDRKESGINAPGNLYSQTIQIDLSEDIKVELPLENTIEQEELTQHPLLREVNYRSQVLSAFWGKDVYLKAAVLLPSSFTRETDRKYPVRYNIAGYGGRYTRAGRYVQQNNSFLDWWLSDDAPQIITVFLDGEGPFGDSYQLDSENSGPYGTALTEELIPHIEEKFRGTGTPESRFVEGCSTGGWVSLALQLFYPDYFGGCFSYSPDPVDFEHFQLINIYHDSNAFTNEYGYLRPVVREISGEPMVSQKDFIQFENVLGWNDTYYTSGGQFSAFTALYSPKGKNGLPKPLFHPTTGEVDHEVAKHWQKHDLKHYVNSNWETLGPKLQGKIWIWMGDMDQFYLNPALRAFESMLRQTSNPESDAVILFSPMTGHCNDYDDRKVLLQIEEKLKLNKVIPQ